MRFGNVAGLCPPMDAIGSVDQLLSTKVLEAAGVDTSRIQFVALGQPQQRAQALVAGQIDATTMSIGTWTAIDDTPGLSVLVDVDAYYRAERDMWGKVIRDTGMDKN